jgi:hypothetical protein
MIEICPRCGEPLSVDYPGPDVKVPCCNWCDWPTQDMYIDGDDLRRRRRYAATGIKGSVPFSSEAL